VIASVSLAAAVSLAACGGEPPDRFAPLRQATTQEIPGSFGYRLVPVEDFASPVDPRRAWAGLPGAATGSDVSVTLAEVDDPRGGGWGPSWVYFTNDLCYFTAKGDFVSPSRAGLEDGCTPQNVLVQVVDASTGEFEAVFEAYDAGLRWMPDRVGSPDQVSGATDFQ
jgi:hypothetical protein